MINHILKYMNTISVMNNKDIEHLYNNFIKSNASKYDVSIETLFKGFTNYLGSENFFLPEQNANDLDVNTINIGNDYCPYIVKKCSDDSHYWKKIN